RAFITRPLLVGGPPVAALFPRTTRFRSSSGTLSGGQVVNRPPPVATTTSVSSAQNPSVFGQSVSFTAVVTPQSGSGTPTGTIQFMIDGSSFGNAVLLSGGAATSSPATGL